MKPKKTLKQVQKEMEKDAEENAVYLEAGKFGPISEEYPFSNIGLYLLIAPPGSGKTRFISQHLRYCDPMEEQNGPKGFYSSVIWVRDDSKMDMTTKAFLKKLKNTTIKYIGEDELIPLLNRLFRRKKKYYALYMALMSELKDLDEDAVKSFQKHNLVTKGKDKDLAKTYLYIASKMAKYHQASFPLRTLIIIDDGAGTNLLKQRNTELMKMIKKCRHYHSTVILGIQSATDASKDLKRMTTDVVLWKGVSESDMETFLTHFALPLKAEEIIKMYQTLKSKYGKIIINTKTNRVVIEDAS